MRLFLDLTAATAAGQLSRARAFLDRFHRIAPYVQLFLAKEEALLTEYLSSERRVVIDVPIGLGRAKALRRMWWQNFNLSRLIEHFGIDVYITFSHYLPHVRRLRIPTVVGVSNLAPFSPEARLKESWPSTLKMTILRHTIISSAKRATRVLALSETGRRILSDYGIPEGKITVTSNGVDSDWAKPVLPTGFLSRMGIVRPYVLYVSHFYEYKNHAGLLEAYADLPAATRKAHQLVLVGKPYSDSRYRETQMLIEHRGMTEDVVLIPGESGERLKELYQNAKLFVFPSLIENSPTILLEAMMAGCPIVASKLAPMPEFCGTAAEYVDPLNVAEMRNRIDALLHEEARLSELRMQSTVQARKFTWDDFVRKVIQVSEMAAGRGAYAVP